MLRPDNLQLDLKDQQNEIASLKYKVDIVMVNEQGSSKATVLPVLKPLNVILTIGRKSNSEAIEHKTTGKLSGGFSVLCPCLICPAI